MKQSTLFKSVALATGILITASTNAQMVGSNVFLKGNYVEAGICDNGDFGASGVPAGYHPHISTKLGFVADPAMDGWAVGTPAYMGDYFVPGSPFEGWNLQIGGIRAYAHSCAGFGGTSGSLTGANISYGAVGSEVIGVWEGTFDSMTVRQETTLDTTALFFTMKITLTNNASVPKNNIYYMRSVDPDNNQSWPGGSFSTNNTITYQLPNALNATVVTATSSTGPASHLSLGTADTNAKCMIYNSWPISAATDLSSVFAGTITGSTYYYAAGSSHPGDIAIGLMFRVPHLSPADSASDSVAYKTTATTRVRPANQYSFTYFYAFSADATDSAIAYIKAKNALDTLTLPVVEDTATGPTYVNTINTTLPIKVYPNPTSEVLNITGLTNTDKLMIYDMMGRNMNQHWIATDRTINTYSMQQLPVGSYMLIVKDQYGKTKTNVPIRKQ